MGLIDTISDTAGLVKDRLSSALEYVTGGRATAVTETHVRRDSPGEICWAMKDLESVGIDTHKNHAIGGKPVKSLFQSCAEHDGAAVLRAGAAISQHIAQQSPEAREHMLQQYRAQRLGR